MSSEEAGEGRGKTEEQAGNSPDNDGQWRMVSYNLREQERPGGLKVRFKIRIQTGRKARDLDARQAAVIRELLIWAHQHPTR
jgi:hypothetical protein